MILLYIFGYKMTTKIYQSSSDFYFVYPHFF
jgi:hypothetical protein